MSNYNPAASVPPPLQGPALPPDWHLICCDEDHGSPSRMANAPNDDGYQQRRSRSALAGQAAGNFAWMSCCEDEACVSPPVEDDRQHRPHRYNFIIGQPSQPHIARRDGTPCGYANDNAPDCCVPTTDSVNVKELAHCPEPECDYQAGTRQTDGLGHPTRKGAEKGIGDCPPDTICCESIHPVPHVTPIGRDAQHAGTGGAPMDCTDEGCCDLDEFVCQDHDMVGACVSFSPPAEITFSKGRITGRGVW